MRAIIIILFLFAGITNSYAQLYVKGYTGYSFSTNPQILKTSITINGFNDRWANKIKVGQGLNAGIALGYKLTVNFAIELTGNTQLFTATQFSNPFPDIRTEPNFSLSGPFGSHQYNIHLYQFSPQLIFNIEYKKLSLYMRAGPNFTKITQNMNNDLSYWDFNFDTWLFDIPKQESSSTSAYGSFTTGIQMAMGIEYPISKSTKLFFEVMNVNSHYRFKEQKTTHTIIVGQEDPLRPQYPLVSSIDEKINSTHIATNFGIKYLFW
jgi:hypothetical protein